jgi:hypothetical protein
MGRPLCYAPLDHYDALRMIELHCVVDPETGCWLWDQALSPAGHGIIYDPATRSHTAAHRVAYQLAGRVIGPGERIERTCGALECCNPAHLVARSRDSTTCRLGHALTVRADGSRTCPTCRRARIDEARIRAALHRVRLGVDKGPDET